jgi:hypothetical protein
MYLEILIDAQKPVIYLLNKPEIYIGSLSTNDIIVSASGISRKHAKLVIQDKKVFITDQGSTNGTYMANERLAPGKRVEFTTLEPVRLGEQVFLTLSEDKNDSVGGHLHPDTPPMQTLNDHDKTQVISLKALEAAKNKKIEKRREEILNKKALEAKRLKAQKDAYIKTFKILLVMVGLIVIFKYSSLFSFDNFNKKFFPKKEIAKEVVLEGLDEESDFKISVSNLISKDDMQIYLASPKCLNPDENYFCERISSITNKSGGVLKVGDDLILFVNEDELSVKTMNLLTERTKAKILMEESITPEFISKINFISFISNSLSDLLDARHQSTNFYVVFITMSENKPALASFFASKGSVIPVIASRYKEKKLSTITDFSAFIHGLDKFYQQY